MAVSLSSCLAPGEAFRREVAVLTAALLRAVVLVCFSVRIASGMVQLLCGNDARVDEGLDACGVQADFGKNRTAVLAQERCAMPHLARRT